MDRQLIGAMLGIERILWGMSTSYVGPNLQVSVSAGYAAVQGDSNANQGLYGVFNDAAVTLTPGAANGSNPRIDRIVLQVNDSTEVGSGADSASLVVIPGTAQSGASFSNQGTWPALPASAMEIACLMIPAGATTLNASLILDRRPKLSGKSIISATQSLNGVNTYTAMATPDQVTNLILPTDGLIRVRYQATWQEADSGQARAALFIDGNQLVIATPSASAPVTQAAAMTNAAATSRDTPLFSTPIGLGSGSDQSVAYTGNATTGQAIGMVASGTGQGIGMELGGAAIDYKGVAGYSMAGAVDIFAAAGAHDIAVKFKVLPTGTIVAAKNRKLWAEVVDPGGPSGGRF